MSAKHSGRVNTIRPFAGNARTVSGGGKQVSVWDQSAGARVWSADADRYEVNAVLPHSTGCVVTSGSYGTVAVFDGDTGALLHSCELEQPGGELFELSDGRVAVGLEEYEDLRLLDVRTGALTELESGGEQGSTRWLRADRSNPSIAESLGLMAGVCRWDLTSRKLLGRVIGPSGEACGWAGDGLAMTLEGDVLSLWRSVDGAVVHRIDALADARGAVASPDGARVAVRKKSGIALIDVERGSVERELQYPSFPRSSSFSSDGRLLAVVVDRPKGNAPQSSLKVFEVETGKDLGGWDGARVSTITMLPGWLLLGKEDGSIERLAM